MKLGLELLSYLYLPEDAPVFLSTRKIRNLKWIIAIARGK